MLISNYAIKFRVAVFVLIVAIIVTGVVSYVTLPREGAPDITIPHVFVTAIYEGTAPAEMEKLVTIPLEKSMSDVENIKEISSSSGEGFSLFDIEFMAGTDIDMARQSVKDKVDLAKPDLPADLDEPIVDAFNFSSDFPVFIFALSGDTDLERLKHIAERLQDEIELVPGVKSADLSGVREREIRVEFDLQRLVAYDIPVGLVLNRIAQENTTISVGNIEIAGDKFQVRVPGEFKKVADLKTVMLAQRMGKPVYLTDVARVTDTYKDLDSISRVNGKPSISISLKKRSGENAVALIETVKELIAEFNFPAGVETSVVMDQSDYVHMMIMDLENNIVTGFILVIGVLFFFMGGRNSLFVAIAIPLSMLAAFSVIAMKGLTLNMIVLFSLVLAVGMLVDNAIVIVENIYRNYSLGGTRIEAAKRGASEVAWPVITSTVTTCAAFSPLLFWPGIMGQFMGFLPQTLIIVLAASLFVAIVINPAVCSALVSRSEAPSAGGRKKHWFIRWYERLLKGALKNAVPVFVIGILLMVLSVMAYGAFGRGQELFPEVEPRNAIVNIKFPQGTGIERTDKALMGVETDFLEKMKEDGSPYQDVAFVLATIGSEGGMVMGIGGGGGTHLANMHVEFKKKYERKGNTMDLVNRMREDIGQIPGAEVTIEREKEGPPTKAPIVLQVAGDDFDQLSQCSSEIMRRISGVDGLVDLADDYEAAVPELQFKVDRKRIAMLGLDTESIGIFLRTAIYGMESSKFRADEDEYDITLRLPPEQRSRLQLMDQIFIPVPAGYSVPLSSLGTIQYTGGRGVIGRKDQKRVITITGNNKERGPDEILKDVKKIIDGMRLPPGYSVTYKGDDEEMKEAAAFLSKAFGVALLLIVVVLVIQFNSVFLPIIILMSVILSLIGVMWGLLICRMKFGVIMTGVGVISLAGIVVNNAIVLVDCIRQQRKKTDSIHEAIVLAGTMRLRPVLLTAATTILGLIPMAVGWSLDVHNFPPKLIAGAETSSWWAPMAVAVIFGLGVATILTLVLVPVMYSIAESVANRLRDFFGVYPVK